MLQILLFFCQKWNHSNQTDSLVVELPLHLHQMISIPDAYIHGAETQLQFVVGSEASSQFQYFTIAKSEV